MSSIKERIAALTGGGKASASSAPPGDQSPKGTVLYSGDLGKFGSGILAATVAKRHAVIHAIDDVAWLSCYDDAAYNNLKGSRLKLKDAAVSTGDDKVQVVAHDEATVVTAKFKASSVEAAQEWARQTSSAGSLAPGWALGAVSAARSATAWAAA